MSADGTGEGHEWDLVIQPSSGGLGIDFKSLYRYRDLLSLFVKRDFTAVYKQTLLGPLWFIIQPLLTTLTFTVVFGRIANIPTDGLPQVLFYMTGVVFWTFFSDCVSGTSDVFMANESVFGKVYFPRLIVPLAIVINNFFRFTIQIGLLIAIYLYFIFSGVNLSPGMSLVLFPFVLIAMASLGLGLGSVFSALTTKYRDLKFLIRFGVQLMMYATPVVYPLSEVPDGLRTACLLNPMTSIVEWAKFSLLGQGAFEAGWLMYSLLMSLAILYAGGLIFTRVEKSFMDHI